MATMPRAVVSRRPTGGQSVNMRMRRARTWRTTVGGAAALAAALAVAAPAAADLRVAAAPAEVAPTAEAVPQIYPAPQEMTSGGEPVPLAGWVTLVVGDQTDAAAVAAAEEIITAAGGKVITTTEVRGSGKEVYLGTVEDNPALAEVLAGMGVEDAAGLPEEGYVLASGRYEGRPVVVLNGVDARGTYYATQTLRQVVEERRLFREQHRMAEGVRQHAVTQPLAGNVVRQRGHGRHRLPAPSAAFERGVRDVVVHPDRFERVVLADARPGPFERRPIDLLRGGLDADRNSPCHRPVSIACMRRPVVTAPCDAEPTNEAYLPMTPPA